MTFVAVEAVRVVQRGRGGGGRADRARSVRDCVRARRHQARKEDDSRSAGRVLARVQGRPMTSCRTVALREVSINLCSVQNDALCSKSYKGTYFTTCTFLS